MGCHGENLVNNLEREVFLVCLYQQLRTVGLGLTERIDFAKDRKKVELQLEVAVSFLASGKGNLLVGG